MALKIRKKYLVLLLVFISIVSYLFWGPLFPWNPFKIGYIKIPASKATVYVNDLTDKDSVVYHINEIIQEEEEFHGLKYVDPFKIVVLNKESNNKRYLPWLNGSGYSVSLSALNLIYIGSNARKSPIGIGPHLKHELSHLLIDQNTSFKKAMKIHKQAWFVEGIAEYLSGHSFYSKNDLRKSVTMNKVSWNRFTGKRPQDMSWQELQIKYSYYRYLIEFLVETYGISKLQEYIKLYLHDPDSYSELFMKVYSTDLEEILKVYFSKLRNGE